MDADSFERAVLTHKDQVHAYAAFMLKDRGEAQDVAQEALIRLWRHRRKVDDGGARVWLMRTTYNLCIDRLRKRKVRSEVDDPGIPLQLRPDAAPGPSRLAEAAEIGRKLEDCLSRLGELDRSVVLLREVQGLPYEEIAEALGLPLGTLKARLHRARERLRRRLVEAGVRP